MNVGRVAVVFIMLSAALGGAFLWYTAERAFYEPVAFTPGAEIRLVPLASDQPEPILVEGIEGTDAESSPIKFRACFSTPLSLAMLTETYRPYENAVPLIAPTAFPCFSTPLSLAMLTETYRPYENAVPLNAPSAFPCFDASAIGAALESGEAVAFLSEPGIHPGVDRVVAVFQDGRAYAWHQLQPEKVVLPASGQDAGE